MKILLIGCGHMGGAMLAGWLGHTRVTRVDVLDPHAPAPSDSRVFMHRAVDTLKGIDSDVAVLAVKPQTMTDACTTLAPVLRADIPVMSIAAGVTLTRLASMLGAIRPLVRAMPNTPGAIGQGITGYVTNDKMNSEQRDTCVFLLSALGIVVDVEDEKHMDAVTAVSGSGPAYVFALAEAMEKAGTQLGLPESVAVALARATVAGAGALMAAKPAENPASLRRAVTSPGGTTAAALDVLGKNHALDTLIGDAVLAACERSKDLAQSQ